MCLELHIPPLSRILEFDYIPAFVCGIALILSVPESLYGLYVPISVKVVVPSISSPPKVVAAETSPVITNSRVTLRADQFVEPPVSTLRMNSFWSVPCSTSLPESHSKSTITSVQSVTETNLSNSSLPGSASSNASTETTIT